MKKLTVPNFPEAAFELFGIIGIDVTLENFSAFMKENKDKQIMIIMHSPGGLLFDAIGIHNLIKNHSYKVTVEVISLAASAASYICTAADEVIVSQNSVFMIHNVHSFAYGDHNKLRDSAAFIEKLSNMLISAYTAKSGLTTDDVKKLMDDETFFIGHEIVDKNFADTYENSAITIREDENVKVAKSLVSDCKAKLDNKYNFLDQLSKAAALLDSLPITLDEEEKSNDNSFDEKITVLENRLVSELNEFSAALGELKNIIETAKSKREEDAARLEKAESELEAQNLLNKNILVRFDNFINDFNSYLNSKLDDGFILPVQHKAFSDFLSSILDLLSKYDSDQSQYSVMIQDSFTEFDSFLSHFNPVNLLDDIAGAPDDSHSNDIFSLENENLKNSIVDPESKKLHAKVLSLMKSENLTYLSAVQKLLNVSKELI